MINLLLLIVILVLLFWQSRSIAKSLWRVGYSITHNQKATAVFVAIIFYPGTILHELAHFLTAAMMMVHVGELELTPEIRGEGIKLGSVEIGQTDPIRRALIGVAPVIWGLIVILSSLLLFVGELNPLNPGFVWWKAAILIYILFVIGNTMFSSRKDMEGSIGLFITIVSLALIVYICLYWIPIISGSPILAPPQAPIDLFIGLFTPAVTDFFKLSMSYLSIPVIINMVVLIIARMVSSFRR